MRATGRWLLAIGCLAAGCHRRSMMPPRPDGAAVVVVPAAVDDGIATAPEAEPNDTMATAQLLPVTPAAPAAVGAAIAARGGAKRDADLFRIDVAGPDAGAPSSVAVIDGGAPPPRFVLRAEVRPDAGLAVRLEALDAAGHSLVNAVGQADDVVAIPNLAALPGTIYLRVRAAGSEGGAGRYRLVVRLRPFGTGAEIEPNGDAAHATELQAGGEAVGYLGWRRDQDWYRVPIAGIVDGSVLTVDFDPVPDVAASLQLYGADARKLTEARGRQGERLTLRNVRLPAGEPAVFVVVRADVGSSAEARYNLRPHADLPKAGAEAEPNDDPAHAQPIGDGTVTGYLARGDVDFYRYTTSGLALLDLEAAAPDRGALEVEVTREDGTLLGRAHSSRHQPARLAGQQIPGGPILIRIVPRHGPIDSDDPYHLRVSSRPAPTNEAAPGAP